MMEEMVLFYSEGHEAHYEPGHPERPERLERIYDTFQAGGIWERHAAMAPIELSKEILGSVHSPGYLDHLQSACLREAHLDVDTYTRKASWDLALNAAGGAAAIADAVWTGRSRRGLALTRPPGHHATSDRGMGFCLLNNVAIAAEYLLTYPGYYHQHTERIAIVDLDLHHGNGTEEIFSSRRDVFYISTHQSPLYPGTGYVDDTGEGVGEGYTANFPLPPGTGDQGFKVVMEELILPLLDRYSPQIVLVSVGYDPHWRDPLGSLLLSATGYHHLITSLVGWCDQHCLGKIALFLEGGYDLQAGEACASAWVASLLGEPFDDPIGLSPHPESSHWNVVVRAAHQIWDR